MVEIIAENGDFILVKAPDGTPGHDMPQYAHSDLAYARNCLATRSPYNHLNNPYTYSARGDFYFVIPRSAWTGQTHNEWGEIAP